MSNYPVIMVEFDAVSRDLWSLLRDIDENIGLGIIVVGEGLHHQENVSKLRLDRSNMILQVIKPFYYTNTFKLRKSFVKHYSEAYGYDFDNIACITKKKTDIKNNIIANKNVCERVRKFYKIKTLEKTCRDCHGSGTHESYDQCGCVEYESNCSSCDGRGVITRLTWD